MNRKSQLVLFFLIVIQMKFCFAVKIEIKDRLLYKGKEYYVDNKIFQKIFEKMPEIKIEPAFYWMNAERGFEVFYEVIDRKVWVTKIVMPVSDTSFSGKVDTIYADVLPRIFNGKKRILADWLTCEMFYYSVKWRNRPLGKIKHIRIKKYSRLTIKNGQIQRNRKLGRYLVDHSKLRQYNKARRSPTKYEFDPMYGKGGELEHIKNYYCDFTTLINYEKLKNHLNTP
jgi:hypothetical protein